MASTIAAVTTSGGGVVTTADASGNLNLLAGTTTVVALTTAGAAVTGTLSATGLISGSLDQVTGFKNRIINGAMVLDQRNAAASQTFTAAAALAYSVDRWYGYCTGANVTGQQVAGSTTPTNTQFRYKFTGAASVTAVGFGQRIEQKNSYDMAGSTCTLSADLAISATLTTVTWTASYATTTADTFGTLASPTVTQIATGTFTVSATVTNFSTNISVPAAATTGIQIVFTVGALTAGLTWTIGNVQLEKGSTATSFDYRPYGTELQLCQRYFQGVQTYFGLKTASGYTRVNIALPVSMRVSPSISYYDGGGNTSRISTFSSGDAQTNNRTPIAVAGASSLQIQILPNNTDADTGYLFNASMSAEL